SAKGMTTARAIPFLVRPDKFIVASCIAVPFSLRQCLDGVSSLLPSDGENGIVEEWNSSTTEDNQNTIFKCSTAPSFPFFNLSLCHYSFPPTPPHGIVK